MAKKTQYDILLESMKEKVNKAGSSRYSKSDHTELTKTLLNTPEQEVPVYVKDSADPVVTKPVENYRKSLKGVLNQFGVDKDEAEKIMTVPFNKDHAEAINDLAGIIVKDYTKTGRKLILPITAKDEAQMELSQVTKAKKIEETRKLVQEKGEYKSVLTGDKKTTAEHKELKASNKVPAWLIKKDKA